MTIYRRTVYTAILTMLLGVWGVLSAKVDETSPMVLAKGSDRIRYTFFSA